MPSITDSPPRAPPIKYTAHLGTRWQKEKAAAGNGAFEYPEDPRFIGPWIIGECVGKGASGRVKIAKHRRTGQLAAVKILPIQPVVNSRASLATQQAKSEKQRLGIDREIIMMKLMNHPNILRIYDVFEGDKELYLVLEYVEGGELFDFLVNRGRLPPLEALAYFKQIVYALNYAHTFSIIHRDLKPENILIHSLNPPTIKIADWGMAAFAPPALQLETSCGSPHYASPEIVNGLKYEGNATDIWSCGVILYALLTGRLPFDDKNVRTLLAKVKTGKYDTPAYIDPNAKDLLSRMLVVDVNKRITIPEIMNHPWFNKPTPGIIYAPAPSVADLARPLVSADHIELDLLESLRVIWGKHGDVHSVKVDLLSPAGEGTLAKAFYFLLHQYREQTMKDNGIILDTNVSPQYIGGKIITKQYISPPIKRHTIREAPAPPSRTPSPRPSGLAPPSPTRSSRSRPPSPLGPRPLKFRPISSPVIPGESPKQRSSVDVPPIDIPHKKGDPDRFRASSVPSVSPYLRPDPQGHFAYNQRIFQPLHVPASPPISSVIPLLEAPRIHDRSIQSTMDHITERVNVLVTRGNSVRGRPAQSPVLGNVDTFTMVDRPSHLGRSRTGPTIREDENRHGRHVDKENRDENGNKHTYHENDIMQISGGLGFGKANGGKVGRDIRNSMHGHDAPKREGTKDKERKGRTPNLDIHSPVLRPRRSTLGSPLQIHSPAMSLLTSPVVGEFKGWFSNLFSWKAHTYVLCSTDNIFTTRYETTRLLETYGISVALEETDGHGLLRCRVNDLIDTTSGSVIQKSARFRIEFSSSPGTSPHPSNPGSATPRLQQNLMSPGVGSARYSMSKFTTGGFSCAIVLIQEKGSVSTFRTVCRWLRDEWTLDALQSPIVGSDGTRAFVEDGH
ncbi:hypothetical protein SERLA73DRAFT_163815 [Serpula lacrymans var. lacrymans S7.3]|uniref:Protein kinase domain-containing protein n=1 Tax=Serpula lacrymans var. lacrymans (strain S7.3) TaxID=936435 RepID=F8QFM0_SERL3|nr:hypothetical protein SERLA73DRAFT_163815 [Serpula lacrymans var. lacrymans S7.3]